VRAIAVVVVAFLVVDAVIVQPVIDCHVITVKLN